MHTAAALATVAGLEGIHQMRKLLQFTVAVAATVATAIPAQAAAPDPIPWGQDVTIIPGACVTEPCPYPMTVHVPDRPF